MSKSYKSQMDEICMGYVNEINALKTENIKLKTDLALSQKNLTTKELELNKYINYNLDQQNELNRCMKNHEKEVALRIKFESKLNNLITMNRTVESKLIVMSKEYQLNTNKITQLLIDLKFARITTQKVKKENNNLSTKNKELTESYKIIMNSLMQKKNIITINNDEISKLKENIISINADNDTLNRQLKDMQCLIDVDKLKQNNLLTQADQTSLTMKQL